MFKSFKVNDSSRKLNQAVRKLLWTRNFGLLVHFIVSQLQPMGQNDWFFCHFFNFLVETMSLLTLFPDSRLLFPTKYIGVFLSNVTTVVQRQTWSMKFILCIALVLINLDVQPIYLFRKLCQQTFGCCTGTPCHVDVLFKKLVDRAVTTPNFWWSHFTKLLRRVSSSFLKLRHIARCDRILIVQSSNFA